MGDLSRERTVGLADCVQCDDRCKRDRGGVAREALRMWGFDSREPVTMVRLGREGAAPRGTHDGYRCVTLREYFRYDVLAGPSTGAEEEEMHGSRR